MKPLVSIIIPVYNVEKYLDKCVASVVNQTYTNLEIILIDDGSTDRSPAICDEWKSRDSRITVIHQPNGGLSRARNAGLKVATGEFIGFVDSDDWIEPKMYEVLLSALQKTDAGIAVCNYQVEPQEERESKKKEETHERKLYSSEEIQRMVLNCEGFVGSYSWNKLYKRSVLENVEFPERKLYEDILWGAKVVGNADKIMCINSVLYHYVQRENSLTHSGSMILRRLHDEIEMVEQRMEFICGQYPSLKYIAISNYQNCCCELYKNISLKYAYLDVDTDIRRKIYQRFRQTGLKKCLYGRNLKIKIAHLLFWFSPAIYIFINIIYDNIYKILF